ncbi:MAG: response regulator [bacterium]|nr:response regulator [bacterium]
MPKKKILLVEDEANIVALVEMGLESYDYELLVVEDGETALEKVHTDRPDLILLDVMLPGQLNGYEVCRRLKDNSKFKDIPVVILSARGQQAEIEKGYEVKADDYIVKPFSFYGLIEKIREMLEDNG